MWRTSLAVDSDRPAGEDRAAVFPTPFGALAVVADGVGGRSGGAAAADAVAAAVRELADRSAPFTSHEWAVWLRDLDRRLAEEGSVGETTAIVASLTALGAVGAAVGDSVAWWVGESGYGDLTEAARPKPWVGSGAARPVAFLKPRNHMGSLLLATDGLVKYAAPEAICRVVRSTPLEQSPRTLIELVRYPSGRLPDDVAVIVTRWVEKEPGA